MPATSSKNTEAIVNAALKLFKTTGYANTSVSDICREADVPRSSFYSIFAGKDEIVMYMMRNLKEDYQAVFAQLLEAKNDLDRIWLLYDRYLSLAVDFGPELTGTLFALELQKPAGLFDLFYAFNDWFVKLIRNCQEQGLIRNQNKPEDIVALGVRIAIGAAYEWCRSGGDFDLREAALNEHETLYDVPPEYKRKHKKERTN